MFERRKHPRIPLQVPVTVIGPEETMHGQAEVLGTHGMGIRCTGKLSISMPVELEFVLPDGPTVRVAAVVWWKESGVVGFRFDLLSTGRNAVEVWVKHRLDQAHYAPRPI